MPLLKQGKKIWLVYYAFLKYILPFSSYFGAFRSVFPDLAIFIFSSIFYVVLKFFSKNLFHENDNLTIQNVESEQKSANSMKCHQQLKLLKFLGIFVSLCFLCLCGASCISIINGIFFLTFLISCTWHIGLNRKLNKKFAIILKLLSILLILDIVALMLYQVKYLKTLIATDEFMLKLLGLINLKTSTHSTVNLKYLMHPFVLMTTYLVITCTSNLIQMTKEEDEDSVDTISLKTPTESEAKLRSLSFNKIKNLTMTFVFEWSFLLTIISMMISSILYHSWLNLVFLIISNFIWILPNQKQAVVMLSPFIVAYSMLLMVMCYIYGMNLLNIDLIKTYYNMNLMEVGFMSNEQDPERHLIIKSILTVPFWMTLRQRFAENTSGIARVSPSRFQLFMSNANKKFLIFAWMWIIEMIIFFQASVVGNSSSLFRLLNMCFFLMNVLVYQLSFVIWKKFLYTFWIMLIVYAKCSLALIYVFQFDNFPEYQFLTEAIGLRKYQTSDLFLKLFSFTIIIILTGVQLNYFHSNFIQYFEQSRDDERSHLEMRKKTGVTRKIKLFVEKLWLFIELHFYKLFFIAAFWIWTLTKRVSLFFKKYFNFY